jgi:hypothetical protein
LFVIKKGGQQKIFSGQRKTLSNKKKIDLVSRKVFSLKPHPHQTIVIKPDRLNMKITSLVK